MEKVKGLDLPALAQLPNIYFSYYGIDWLSAKSKALMAMTNTLEWLKAVAERLLNYPSELLTLPYKDSC